MVNLIFLYSFSEVCLHFVYGMADSAGDHFCFGDFPEIVVESDSDQETEVCQVCFLSIVMCNVYDFWYVLYVFIHGPYDFYTLFSALARVRFVTVGFLVRYNLQVGFGSVVLVYFFKKASWLLTVHTFTFQNKVFITLILTILCH